MVSIIQDPSMKIYFKLGKKAVDKGKLRENSPIFGPCACKGCLETDVQVFQGRVKKRKVCQLPRPFLNERIRIIQAIYQSRCYDDSRGSVLFPKYYYYCIAKILLLLVL
jgi:hypothetical protein